MPPKPKGEVRALHPIPRKIILTGVNPQSSNLIRVRNNQRRSRARRREYVAELERKLHECQAQGLEPCTPDGAPQDTIRRLEEENRKLRELLALSGVQQASVDTHLAVEGGLPKEAADGDNPLQMLPEPVADEASILDASEEMLAESSLQLPEDAFGMFFEPLQSTPYFDPSFIPPSFSPHPLPFPHELPLSPQGIKPPCPTESLLPTSCLPNSGTTLCSVAYELVREQNKRAVDMIEIGIRLWNGFLKGEGAGGCRVDNELLASVLEYIKG